MQNQMDKYEKIIDLPHPTSRKRPRMAIIDRAAQFAPFSAVTGHDAAVRETARQEEAKWERAEYAELDPSEM